ncbi:MAG TPA: iron ABC transporter permease, partial [Ktedonobacterales bacterium]|nr:iron ABC transporter permease [Ktedonobacterales bacterium]
MARILERQPNTATATSVANPRPSSPLYGNRWRRGLATLAAYRALVILPVLAVALFVAIVFATAIGAVPISPLTTAQILLNQTQVFHFPAHWPTYDQAILLRLRLPGVLGAALVGMALGTAGTLFQGVLRNPLADPLLLGTSSGAALGATIAFAVTTSAALYWQGFGVVAAFAFLGALLAVALVYALATRGGQTPVVTLLLAGVAISAVLTAAQTLIITLDASLQERLASLYFWVSGSVNVQDWSQVEVVALLVGVGLLASLMLAPALDALALGEEMATHVGLRVERQKLLIVAVASLLVAAAVSISGLVGFVGLVTPHACRLILGPRNRLLLPAAALAGGIFVTLADLLARTLIAPTILPLGIITALVGAPFFLALLRRAG